MTYLKADKTNNEYLRNVLVRLLNFPGLQFFLLHLTRQQKEKLSCKITFQTGGGKKRGESVSQSKKLTLKKIFIATMSKQIEIERNTNVGVTVRQRVEEREVKVKQRIETGM